MFYLLFFITDFAAQVLLLDFLWNLDREKIRNLVHVDYWVIS